MILSGTFLSEFFGPSAVLLALFAATGVILAAIYMLHAVLKLFFGPVTREENRRLADLSWREATALAPLVLMVFWIGLYPATFLEPMEASVKNFAAHYAAKLNEGDERPNTRAIFSEKDRFDTMPKPTGREEDRTADGSPPDAPVAANKAAVRKPARAARTAGGSR